MPSRVLATPSSSCAMRRCWPRAARKSFSKFSAPLVRLCSRLPGAAVVVARGETLPRYDFHCPLLSLPLACATTLETIPAEVPYIAPADADVASWRARLPQRRPRIGLVWSGERSHDNDLNRSIRLATLKPLLDLPEVAFVSLQHEVRDEDCRCCKVLKAVGEVCAIGGQFKDFADTAAADRTARRGDCGRYRRGAFGRRHGQAAVFAAAVCCGFPLAARARGQPVVSERTTVSSATIRRLGQRRRRYCDTNWRCSAAVGAGRRKQRRSTDRLTNLLRKCFIEPDHVRPPNKREPGSQRWTATTFTNITNKPRDHHEHAAKHHREAAKHHKAGNHEKAAHHSKVAHGHHLHATEHHEHAAKMHAEEHS